MAVVGEPGDLGRAVFDTSFLGIPMLQWWSDLTIWERIFNGKPLKHVIELGSGRGAMSAYLLMQCIQNDARYTGFDHVTTQIGPTPMGKLLDVDSHIVTGDLWANSGYLRAIVDDPENHPLLLFCDNGEKPREFREFMPLLWAGDVVAVHDFGNEFTDMDVAAVPGATERLGRLMGEECDALKVLTRWWDVVA